jgi:hypothetical protein
MSLRVVTLLLVGLAIVACGSATPAADDYSGPRQFTAADEACVDFYRAAQDSVEEEPVYMRRFAERISELGYTDAGEILTGLADEWDVGIWNEANPELRMSAQWAEAGALLGSAGAIRCTDLAEWWGIEGYEGEPDPTEMMERQESIWHDLGPSDYFLLIAGQLEGQEDLTQVHVRIEDGEVTSVIEVDSGPMDVGDLPRSVDELYSIMQDEEFSHATYDLVWSVPRSVGLADGRRLFLRLDTDTFPEPIIELDTPETEHESG